MGLQSVQLQLQYTWMFSSLSEKGKENQKKKKNYNNNNKKSTKDLRGKNVFLSLYFWYFEFLNLNKANY